jgi:small subunit ribosomal protein S9
MTDEAPTPETEHEETGTPDRRNDVVASGGESPAMGEAGADASAGASLDIGSQAEAAEAGPRPAGLIRGRIDERGVATGTGRRKTAVARVRISDGQGKFTVNGRQLTDYFPLERNQQMIYAPLKATAALANVDVWVRVRGGGPTGQTGAVVLGIARALQAKYPGLHEKLSEGGYLTRDGRMVERKKYGRRKARRSFQFSKR